MPSTHSRPFLPRQVVVTGVGLVTPLGGDLVAVHDRLRRGDSGLRPGDDLRHLPDDLAGIVDGPDLRPWLKRRKDRKLMARSAELALAAAGPALGDWSTDPAVRADIGLYVAVGREPPDGGESEPTLAAAHRDGALDQDLLAGPGRDRYPPLLPLKTLPNMALAHVSMNLDISGPNGAWTGRAAAGLVALNAALWAVGEGRCDVALAGAADSLVDLGSARDRLRDGRAGPPGEAAVFLRLEALPLAWDRRAPILAMLEPADPYQPPPGPVIDQLAHHAAMGDCGAADGLLALVREVIEAQRTTTHRTVVLADPDLPPVATRVRAPLAC